MKQCFYIAPKAIFSRYLQCFLHITHPKGCMQHSTKNSNIELPCRKTRFLRERIPANMRKKQSLSLGLKKCFYIAPKASLYLQCFLHITNPKGCMQHSTKNSNIELPCRKNAFFFYANASPQTCARSNFSCNLQCFFHISNTDFDPQKSANHCAPPTPPKATAEKTSQRFQRFPSQVCMTHPTRNFKASFVQCLSNPN